MHEKLIENLERWKEIAENMHESGDWDRCSLLHSFSDSLARDIGEAIHIIKTGKPYKVVNGPSDFCRRHPNQQEPCGECHNR